MDDTTLAKQFTDYLKKYKTNNEFDQYTKGPWLAVYGSVYTEDQTMRLLTADRDEPLTRPYERDNNIIIASFSPEMIELLTKIRDKRGLDTDLLNEVVSLTEKVYNRLTK